jgi:hypothetical protein
MTSREHARRLMLILLASEGTALRRASEDRRERDRIGGDDGQGGTGAEADGPRERDGEELRMWLASTPLGVA